MVEGGRQGYLSTEDGDDAAFADAVRLAVAHSRVARAPSPPPPAAAAEPPPSSGPRCFDPEVANLEPRAALARLQGWVGRGERARLEWAVHRVVLVRSAGPPCRAAVTGLSLAVRAGRGAGAGFARTAARTLEALAGPGLVERARARATADEATSPPPPRGPLLLAPEVAATLVGVLAGGLSARAFEAGRLFSPEDLGREVLSPRLTLRDDGGAAGGLPFPFDDRGRLRRPVVHFEGGRLLTPAVDEALAATLGLPLTPQAVAADDACPRHLFLAPGVADEAGLLAAAQGGLSIGALEPLAPFGPAGGRFRGVARGVRAIAGGALGEPLPPLLWEDDVLRVFGQVLEVGAEAVAVALDRDLFAAASAPALVVDGGGSLLPAP